MTKMFAKLMSVAIVAGGMSVATTTSSGALECADPPSTKAGRCAQAANGRCNSKNGMWVSRDKAAFKRCMAS